jgi:hypothetical protein
MVSGELHQLVEAEEEAVGSRWMKQQGECENERRRKLGRPKGRVVLSLWR